MKYLKKFDEALSPSELSKTEEELQFGISDNVISSTGRASVIRLLSKFFYWLKSVVEVIYDLVIYPLKRGHVITSIIGLIEIFIVAGIVYLFSITILIVGDRIFSVGDVMLNGIERGRVEKVEFIPAHNDISVINTSVSNRSDWYYYENYPDGWQVYVSDGERVETWVTHSRELVNTTQVGDSLTNVGWRWTSTIKR